MLTDYQQKLIQNAIRRKKLFLILSIISVVIALGLAVFYTWEATTLPAFDTGIHFVLVILILLNARQNLRQYNYAKVLESMTLKNKADTNI
jgi:hypothetical protein